MTSRTSTFPPLRLLPLLVAGLLVIVLAGRMSDSIVADHLADSGLTSRNLGVDPDVVSASTVIHVPAGELAGPAGIEVFVASLQRDYPGARFAVTDTRRVGRMVIVDWQGTRDGNVVIPGRTLITIEDGRITRLMFLNLNYTSPIGGGPSQQLDLVVGAERQPLAVADPGTVFVPERPDGAH
jgi:hypothetical protein